MCSIFSIFRKSNTFLGSKYLGENEFPRVWLKGRCHTSMIDLFSPLPSTDRAARATGAQFIIINPISLLGLPPHSQNNRLGWWAWLNLQMLMSFKSRKWTIRFPWNEIPFNKTNHMIDGDSVLNCIHFLQPLCIEGNMRIVLENQSSIKWQMVYKGKGFCLNSLITQLVAIKWFSNYFEKSFTAVA